MNSTVIMSYTDRLRNARGEESIKYILIDLLSELAQEQRELELRAEEWGLEEELWDEEEANLTHGDRT